MNLTFVTMNCTGFMVIMFVCLLYYLLFLSFSIFISIIMKLKLSENVVRLLIFGTQTN